MATATKTKIVKSTTKSTAKAPAKKSTKPVKLSSKSASAGGSRKASSTKGRPLPAPQSAPAAPDPRRPLADIIRERQIAQGLENTTAFEISNNETGEKFIVASHLSPRMDDRFDPATVTVTPKATARAGSAGRA